MDQTIEQIKAQRLQEEFGVSTSTKKQIEEKTQNNSEKEYSEKQWGEMDVQELTNILGQTIKRDNFNKVLVFLCQLLTYTEDSQINVSFNAPSSSGKSYLAIEISKLFPGEDIIELAYASPTSFFHTSSYYDKDRKLSIIDLSRKILIFLDMPHTSLLEHLRPLLSHDKKEIRVKITDKNNKTGIKAKDIAILGYPSVLFCSASFKYDEQELTRFILLSPETSQEKIREAVLEKIKKESNPGEYYKQLNSNPLRNDLIERIGAIKKENIQEILIGNKDRLEKKFFERNKVMKPRHSRDIQRISSLSKAFALLNLWTRKRNGSILETNDEDIENAYRIWDEISVAQDLGLPPYILNLYKEVIVPAYEEKGTGLTRQDILAKHFIVYSRHIQDWQLRQELLPKMEISGVIYQEPDPSDRRKVLVYPQLPLTISSDKETAIKKDENFVEPNF